MYLAGEVYSKDPNAVNEWSEEHIEVVLCDSNGFIQSGLAFAEKEWCFNLLHLHYNEKENEENLNWLLQEKKAKSLKLKIESRWGIEEVTVNDIFGYRFFLTKQKEKDSLFSVVRKNESSMKFLFIERKHLIIRQQK